MINEMSRSDLSVRIAETIGRLRAATGRAERPAPEDARREPGPIGSGPLTPDAIRTLCTKGHYRPRLLSVLSYLCALRRIEACRLPWSCVDWTGHRIWIARAKGSRSRWYDLPESVILDLATWKGSMHGRHGFNTEYIFPDKCGRSALPVRSFSRLMREHAENVGVYWPGRDTGQGYSAFRRAAADSLASKGTDLRKIANALGHRRTTSTAAYLEDLGAAPTAELAADLEIRRETQPASGTVVRAAKPRPVATHNR